MSKIFKTVERLALSGSCQAHCTSMAEMLEGLSVEDLAIKSNFLDQCFQMKSDQLVDVETAAGHLENCLVLSEELDL